MNLKNRLSKIESYRPKINWPSNIEMPITQDKPSYDAWLLANNTGLTQERIDTELDIKHLDYFYAE
jgi:hypothetical protein